MSGLDDLANAWMVELTTNVDGLADAKVHDDHSPYNPTQLQTNVGETHVAIWPTVDAETRDVLSNDAHELAQGFVVLVWEATGSDIQRRVENPKATAAFHDLWEAVRDRFYVSANQWIGGSERTWYERTDFPDDIYAVRWFQLRFGVRRYKGFS